MLAGGEADGMKCEKALTTCSDEETSFGVGDEGAIGALELRHPDTSNVVSTMHEAKTMLRLIFVFTFRVRFLDPEFLQAILQRAKRQAEQLRRFGDVVISLIHGLENQVFFYFFKVDAFGRKLETAGHCALRFLANLRWQV